MGKQNASLTVSAILLASKNPTGIPIRIKIGGGIGQVQIGWRAPDISGWFFIGPLIIVIPLMVIGNMHSQHTLKRVLTIANPPAGHFASDCCGDTIKERIKSEPTKTDLIFLELNGFSLFLEHHIQFYYLVL